MKHIFFDSSISLDTIINALRSTYENAQKTMKPFTEAEDAPFDVLPSILAFDYAEAIKSLNKFERDITAIRCYANGTPPLEFEIIDKHTDKSDTQAAIRLKEQLNEWIYSFTAVTDDE